MTAVEWFAKELKKRYKRNNAHLTISQWSENMIDKLSKQANEMFEQQIIDAFDEGNPNGFIIKDGKQYYSETYKKDKI